VQILAGESAKVNKGSQKRDPPTGGEVGAGCLALADLDGQSLGRHESVNRG
jgi:hypothetical protein